MLRGPRLLAAAWRPAAALLRPSAALLRPSAPLLRPSAPLLRSARLCSSQVGAPPSSFDPLGRPLHERAPPPGEGEDAGRPGEDKAWEAGVTGLCWNFHTSWLGGDPLCSAKRDPANPTARHIYLPCPRHACELNMWNKGFFRFVVYDILGTEAACAIKDDIPDTDDKHILATFYSALPWVRASHTVLPFRLFDHGAVECRLQELPTYLSASRGLWPRELPTYLSALRGLWPRELPTYFSIMHD